MRCCPIQTYRFVTKQFDIFFKQTNYLCYETDRYRNVIYLFGLSLRAFNLPAY